jgi:adenylyltransferase/sulfurtransferase
MPLSVLEKDIYHRQMMLDGWGEKVQEKLKDATVFVAGAGGLGSPASIYLAVAGIGQIRLCDFDRPDWSNLNRQILHDSSRIGINKAVSGKKTLEKLNGLIRVAALPEKITEESVDRLVGKSDVILDCMDNFETRYVLNDCAIRLGIPMIHASVRGLEGRLTFLHPPETPCLRCLIPEAPPREVFPILGATPGVIGSLQAMEAIKYLSGVGQLLKGRLLVWDGAGQEFLTMKLQHDPNCRACAKTPKSDQDLVTQSNTSV